jgi:hypothetical protein
VISNSWRINLESNKLSLPQQIRAVPECTHPYIDNKQELLEAKDNQNNCDCTPRKTLPLRDIRFRCNFKKLLPEPVVDKRNILHPLEVNWDCLKLYEKAASKAWFLSHKTATSTLYLQTSRLSWQLEKPAKEN